MIRAERFKLPFVTISAEVLHEVKKEDSSSQDNKHIQEGKWLKNLVQRHYARQVCGG